MEGSKSMANTYTKKKLIERTKILGLLFFEVKNKLAWEDVFLYKTKNLKFET